MSFKNLYIEENLFRLQRFVTIVYILRNAATCIHKFFVKFISLASVEHINQNRGQLKFRFIQNYETGLNFSFTQFLTYSWNGFWLWFKLLRPSYYKSKAMRQNVVASLFFITAPLISLLYLI